MLCQAVAPMVVVACVAVFFLSAGMTIKAIYEAVLERVEQWDSEKRDPLGFERARKFFEGIIRGARRRVSEFRDIMRIWDDMFDE